jgi:hypothetical protein
MSCLGLGTWDLDFECGGKSQLPCSQGLRLDGLTSSDLGPHVKRPLGYEKAVSAR